jgi:hypothetical protein
MALLFVSSIAVKRSILERMLDLQCEMSGIQKPGALLAMNLTAVSRN